MSDFFEFLNKLEDNESKNSNHQEDFDDDFEEESSFEDDEEDLEDEHQSIKNDVEDDDEQIEVQSFEDEEDDKLDIIEKSLEYSKSVIKVIKENFNKKEQKVMLQTLRNTINLYLGDSGTVENKVYVAPVDENKNVSQEPQQTLSSMTQVPSAHSGVKSTMTEEEWNNFDTNQYDYTYESKSSIPVDQLTIKNTSSVNESRSRTYSKDLPLAVKVTSEGKKEVDLSKISSRDVDDMKVLMGIK